MSVVNVRIDEETKALMKTVNVNWSRVVREAIQRKVAEEKSRNLAKAVLINERVKKVTKGESAAEDIIRKFRDDRGRKAGG